MSVSYEHLRRAVEDGERLYRKRMHDSDGAGLTIEEEFRVDGILTRELESALALVDDALHGRDLARLDTDRERQEGDAQRQRAHRLEEENLDLRAALQAAQEALDDSQRECAHHHRSTVEAEKALRFIAGEYVDGCEAWRGLSNEQVARAVLVEGADGLADSNWCTRQ